MVRNLKNLANTQRSPVQNDASKAPENTLTAACRMEPSLSVYVALCVCVCVFPSVCLKRVLLPTLAMSLVTVFVGVKRFGACEAGMDG